MTIKERKMIEDYLYETINNRLLCEDDDNKGDKSLDKKRSKVVKWLRKPAINNAEIMRQLWSPSESEEDAKRSYFYKCRDGVKNDDGVPYKFSDDDITSLWKIMSQAT